MRSLIHGGPLFVPPTPLSLLSVFAFAFAYKNIATAVADAAAPAAATVALARVPSLLVVEYLAVLFQAFHRKGWRPF